MTNQHEKAKDIEIAYNANHEVTQLKWTDGIWRMMHSGNATNQSYSDAELIDVGTRLGWTEQP